MTPKLHPACEVWNPLPNDQLKELAQDIKDTTLRESIVMLEDKILDGRNRWLALELIGLDPQAYTREFGSDRTDGNDPVRWAMSKNARRRHATKPEIDLAAAGYANLGPGGKAGHVITGISGNASMPVTLQEAADKMGTTRKRVEEAKALLTHATPNVIEMVKKEKIPLERAARAARATSKEEQINWSAPSDVPKKEDVKRIKEEKQEDKTEKNDKQYSWPCIPDQIKEVELTEQQHKIIEEIQLYFKDRRSQRILITMLQELWPWSQS